MQVRDITPSVVLAVVLSLVISTVVYAQSGAFPNKPVRIIVPYEAGGGVNAIARLIAQRLSEAWGQSVVIVNRGGAGSTLGTGIAAKARPDGYTLLFNSIALATNATLYQPLPYDTLRDLAPVCLLATQSNVLVINPSVPANSVAELIQFEKAKPGRISIGSGGGAAHLATELFRSMSGLNVVIANYKGGGQALIALMSGDVQMLISTMSDVLPHITSGKVKALAVTGAKRSSIAPSLPTLSEVGLAGYEYSTWYGVLTPAGVPTAIISQLNQDIIRALESPEVRKWFASTGLEPLISTPEEFAHYLRTEIAKWAKVIEAAGIKP